MPLPAESLTPQSSDVEVRKAISASIEMCMREGGDPKQCQAMAYSMARKAMASSGNERINAALEK